MPNIINDNTSKDRMYFDIVTYTGDGVARELHNISPVQSDRPGNGQESERESIKAQIMALRTAAEERSELDAIAARNPAAKALLVRLDSLSAV